MLDYIGTFLNIGKYIKASLNVNFLVVVEGSSGSGEGLESCWVGHVGREGGW